MSRGTTARAIRIPQDLWDAALARADAEGTTVSNKVRDTLTEWVNDESAPST